MFATSTWPLGAQPVASPKMANFASWVMSTETGGSESWAPVEFCRSPLDSAFPFEKWNDSIEPSP
jgi:hypothetical protein